MLGKEIIEGESRIGENRNEMKQHVSPLLLKKLY